MASARTCMDTLVCMLIHKQQVTPPLPLTWQRSARPTPGYVSPLVKSINAQQLPSIQRITLLSSLAPLISPLLPPSFPLCISLSGSLRLVPVCRGINQTINVTAIYIGNVICKKLISTLHLYICSRSKFVLEEHSHWSPSGGFGKRDRDVFI